MKLLLVGHDDRYAVEQLQLSLFPAESMEPADGPFKGDGTVSTLHRSEKKLTAVTKITRDGVTRTGIARMPAENETVPARRWLLQRSYYRAAFGFLKEAPAWGALAGVRPTKISTRMLREGMSVREARGRLQRDYFVSPDRSRLALDASKRTMETLSLLDRRDISMYVGIPFCPSRCVYCSFVSQTVGRDGNLLEPYLQGLLKEIQAVGQFLENSGLRLRTLYIGGGTPTILNENQMDRLLDALEVHMDLKHLLEYTVEAGRPDTVTQMKLQVLKKHGVSRISINPQSMNNRVLAACGRPHTAKDIIRAWKEATLAGFTDINMDLIAGLPADTPESFIKSLEQVLSLRPSNITVHTLALKKGAFLAQHKELLLTDQDVSYMVERGVRMLRESGYSPYYLYRQKYMTGSFENVGWMLPGAACHYNICMMEELHSILALGGGGMSKVNLPGGRLQRYPNPKFPQEYLERLDQIIRQKAELVAEMSAAADAQE